MMRGLQIAVARIILFSALAAGALWMRSYYWTDEGPFLNLGPWSLGGGSSVGRMAAGVMNGRGPSTWRHAQIADSAVERKQIDARFSAWLGFGVAASGGWYVVMWPDWFVVVTCVALAAAARRRMTFRFSLRVLFTVMTLLAVVLGAAVVLSK
jgi:hypothetical protein